VHVIDIVIFAGWVAFWIYWLAASIGVKAGQSRWARFAGFRIGVILVILLLRVRGHKGSYPEYKRSTKMLIPFIF
jgi:hypothetical protein